MLNAVVRTLTTGLQRASSWNVSRSPRSYKWNKTK